MRRKVNTLTYLVVALIAINGYLIYRAEFPSSETLKAVEAKADEMLEQARENSKKVDSLLLVAKASEDTIKIIERKRTINNNAYVQNVTRILANDSSAQFREYNSNVTKFDSLFFSGFIFNRLSR